MPTHLSYELDRSTVPKWPQILALGFAIIFYFGSFGIKGPPRRELCITCPDVLQLGWSFRNSQLVPEAAPRSTIAALRVITTTTGDDYQIKIRSRIRMVLLSRRWALSTKEGKGIPGMPPSIEAPREEFTVESRCRWHINLKGLGTGPEEKEQMERKRRK
ncbi:hypothetical protein C8R44DRAFT_725966 [Mycena epipterygia]|nr:hypothetical protein C8R44DRAFT_725966 [Mycena epipterygia]